MLKLKTSKDIESLRKSGVILTRILITLKERVRPGIRLCILDDLAKDLLKEAGARSAFFGYKPEGTRRGYKGYPAHICTSVNDQIVHGLPTDYELKNGDVLKIDLGVNYEGYITDAAFTVGVGEISEEAEKLMRVTKKALEKAIESCKPGGRLGDIGFAIEETVRGGDFDIVKNLTGHGVGFKLHEEPTIFNFGDKGTGIELKEGMVLAIEPMVAVGSGDITHKKDDSYATLDGSLSAHFEATVAIIASGPENLTPHL